jgi:hypothetical protein
MVAASDWATKSIVSVLLMMIFILMDVSKWQTINYGSINIEYEL